MGSIYSFPPYDLVSGKTYGPNDTFSIDGSTGDIIEGRMPTIDPEMSGPFETIMKWADKHRTLAVRTNADTPNDAEVVYVGATRSQ